MPHHLKYPSYNNPYSFFFLQENKVIVIKMGVLGGSDHIVNCIFPKDCQAAESTFPQKNSIYCLAMP